MVDDSSDRPTVKPGQSVFDESGAEIGVVRGLSNGEFIVDSADSVDYEVDPGQEFGEGYLMWRCSECGEMGDLDGGFPEACPNCDARREDLYAYLED